jgi:putative membrane protein
MRTKSHSRKLAGFSTAVILCTSSLCWAAGDELSRGDKQFLQDASELALGEIELGKLAQSNGSSPDVKQLGNKLVADHTKSLNELKAIATAKRIGLDWKLTTQQSRLLSAFENKSGAEFDKEFREQVGKDNEKAIKIFQDTAKNTKDYDVREYAGKSLVALRTHRLMAAGHGAPEAVGERTAR